VVFTDFYLEFSDGAEGVFPPLLDRLGFLSTASPERKAVEATKGFSGPKKGPMSVVLLLHYTT
jgi:hypothetical protein